MLTLMAYAIAYRKAYEAQPTAASWERYAEAAAKARREFDRQVNLQGEPESIQERW